MDETAARRVGRDERFEQSAPARRWVYIIPMAVVMYILAYIDRINVGMILPYVSRSFGLSPAAAGFASGLFFIGYMILQIPGGILAGRWSARKTVALLMLFWGISAILTGFVQNRMQLYLARFVLGFFEGGVWPAILVLLASWFPKAERARANAFWILCLPLGAVIMSPVTGWLLTFLQWRAVFIIEGIPPLLMLLPWWFLAADHPREAAWAAGPEREQIERQLRLEAEEKPESSGYGAALSDPTVLWLVAVYFFWMAGFYGYTLWVPSVVKSLTHGSSVLVGALTAVPFVFACLAMAANSVWSDKVMKRQAFFVVPAIIGAVGLIGGQFVGTPELRFAFLIIAAIGVYAPYGPFWAVPTSMLRAEVSGAAMGLVNMGNLGGFLGPYLVGALHRATGSGFAGFIVLGIFLLVAAGIFLYLKVDRRIGRS